ncbi:MAG: hypothetical protein WAW85_00650 [Gordonia sp. (in: high G+C Gram-positive bacteria)]|uniref:hypothetical protein n=1 Tax=Gordonia sp. (in: high G+C Gram-positive bacteria) TaxID=84139 RepID=UPI003BB7EDDF
MYYAIILGCFVVFPVASILIEHHHRRQRGDDADLPLLVLRWFTFWIVGVRLFTAGLISIRAASWTPAAAVAGAVFLGLSDGGSFTADRALAAGTDLFGPAILLGALLVVTVQVRRSGG